MTCWPAWGSNLAYGGHQNRQNTLAVSDCDRAEKLSAHLSAARRRTLKLTSLLHRDGSCHAKACDSAYQSPAFRLHRHRQND